jgi:hypothetical protein
LELESLMSEELQRVELLPVCHCGVAMQRKRADGRLFCPMAPPRWQFWKWYRHPMGANGRGHQVFQWRPRGHLVGSSHGRGIDLAAGESITVAADISMMVPPELLEQMRRQAQDKLN